LRRKAWAETTDHRNGPAIRRGVAAIAACFAIISTVVFDLIAQR
jgi:hypothetical protein